MIGITGYGFYVPRFRLPRATIARAWGSRQAGGERAVANYDEDALTLAAEAAADALAADASLPDGLLFASTTSPYGEKQVASFIATACDLPRAIWTADFGGSARAGLSGVLAAWQAVASGMRSDILVAAADVRLGEPQGELEGWFGDGGGALRIGRGKVLAELIDHGSVSEEFTHFWRTDDSRFVQLYSGKFSDTYGYVRDMGEAIRLLLERQKLAAGGVARLVVATPDARAGIDLAKHLGFDAKQQLVTPLHATVGSAGVADPILALIGVLETASPGDLIVVGAYGEGADAVLLRVTDQPFPRHGRTLAQHLEAKVELPTYEKYLHYRRLLPVEELGETVTNILEYKELKQDVRLYGSRCSACGTVQFPIARVCIKCKVRDGLVEQKLAHRGTVFTFTIDHLIPNMEHPLPMVVVDLDGGGRVYLQATDADDTEVQVGAPVELTFRRLHEGGGNHNYFWKARPPR